MVVNKINKSILSEALRITDERILTYGDPVENLENIAKLWNTYIKSKKINYENDLCIITSKDVAMMMVLLKVARELNSTNKDNLIDIAGYCRLASVIEGFENI
jgi:hypothetical protein